MSGEVRYDLERLRALAGLTRSQLQRRCGIGGRDWSRYWAEGLSWKVADRCAGRCGFHPAEVWPEWINHAEEDSKKPCATCGAMFVPHRRTVLYCSQRCRRLVQQRRYRSRPEVAEKNRQRRREAYAETAEYERARQRRYYAENRELVLARRRARGESRPCSSVDPATTLNRETSAPRAAGTAGELPEPGKGSEMAESTSQTTGRR